LAPNLLKGLEPIIIAVILIDLAAFKKEEQQILEFKET